MQTAIICAGNALYNVYFHPLRKFPGPIICRATGFYRHFKFLSGELPFVIKSLHDCYGPVVRIAPNELSFISPQAWKDIYLPLADSKGPGEMVKYDGFYRFTGPKAPDTILTLNMTDHAQLRRQIGPAFSERTLRMQESAVQQYVDLLIRKLGEESKHGKIPLNLREWFNYYAFDVIGNLGFGSDFSGLEHSKYHPWVRAVTQNVKEYSFLQVLMYLKFQWLVHLIANSSLLRGKILHEHLTRQKLESRMEQDERRPDLIDPFLRLEKPLVWLSLLVAIWMV